MSKAIGLTLLGVLVAGVVGSTFISYKDNKAQKAIIEKQNAVKTVKGLIALDVESYFKDQRVIDILIKNNIAVDFKKVGSRDMPTLMTQQKYDFAFASGIVAGNQIVNTLKQSNVQTTSMNIFYSPMIIGSYKDTAEILSANGIAKYDSKHQVYNVDMSKLLPVMLNKGKWSDFKHNDTYNFNKSVLVSTTDVRKSNSSAMYLALSSYILNNGEVITDRDVAEKMANKVADLYKRQGYQENYVSGNFDDYKQGIGKSPLAFIYEYQLYQYAMTNKKLKEGMVLMYPAPTILNKEVFVAVTSEGKTLAELLMTNQSLQDIAIEYGFRTSELTDKFVKQASVNKMTVLPEIRDQIDPPSFEIMDTMIKAISLQLQ